MTGLRGEAAIVGIAELPAETQARPSRRRSPSTSTPTGQDGARRRGRRRGCGERASRRTGSPSRTCSLRPRCPNTWACPSISVSASISAGRPRPPWCGARRSRSSSGCATRCWRSCPVRRRCRVRVAARADAELVWGVEQQLRLPAGRVRDPVRQRRPERPVRADRAALRRRVRLRPAALAKIAVDQRTNACAHPGAVFPRHADHRRRRAGQPDDRRSDPHAGDRDAGPRRRRRAGRERRSRAAARHRPVWIKGFGEHIAFKTPTYAEDLMRTPIARAAERAFAMAGLQRSDVDMASIYDCYTITVLMTLEDAGFCAEGPGDGVDHGPRPDLPRRLPAQHRGRPTVLRAGRYGRWHAPRRRRRPPGDGPLRGSAGRRLPTPRSSPATAAS